MELKNFQQLEISRFLDPPKEKESKPAISNRTFFKNLSKSISPLVSKKEIVAGGDIKWIPVTREASRLLSRVSHIYKPQPDNNMGRGRGVSGRGADLMLKTAKSLDEQGDAIFADKNKCGDVAAMIGNKIIKNKNDMPKQISEFTEEVNMAKEKLNDYTDLFRKDMIEFVEQLPDAIKRVRDWRMTIDREKSLSVQSLRELRQFFLESDYEKEMARLSEFVRMCERMKALSDDGTLEKVSDVMLKLATK